MSLLARLLGAWRTTYDEALVEPIIRLGEQLAAARSPLRARTQAALESLWKATLAEGDPLDVERLFAARWPKQRDPLRERLAALAAAPPDPRFVAKLLALRSRYPSGELDVDISGILARCPTVQLEVLLDAYRPTAFGRARIALERVKRRPCDPRLLEEARAALAPVVEPRTAPALRARPMDSATRSVLADELQAAGDPRGDFIAMQLAIANGTASPAVVKRAAKLLETHVATWLRPFPNAIAHACRFERGFPVAIASGARGRALDQAIDRPEWATIEELAIDGRDADLERLLRTLPLLRTLSTRDEVLERLRGPYPYIRSLGTPATWICADGSALENARYCLRGHRRRFGDANVRFDGAMIDLAALPKQARVSV